MWSQALRLIQTRAAGLVAALENMTMAQLNFRSGIAIKSKDWVRNASGNVGAIFMSESTKISTLTTIK